MRMPGIFRSSQPVISASTVISLNPAGKREAQECSESGTRFDIFDALDEGEKTLSDLARRIVIPIDETRREVLKMRGYVVFHNNVG